MPRIPALTNDQAAPAARELLIAAQAAFGMVPNTFRTLAHAPEVFEGFVQLNKAIHKTALSAAERESIALTTAEFNGCLYCLTAHTFLGKHAGLSPAAIAAARELRRAA